MAITPRSLFRSPLLLAACCLTWATMASAAYVVTSGPCSRAEYKAPAPAVVMTTPAPVEIETVKVVETVQSTKGWLGVHILTLNPARAARAGVQNARGVLILDVPENHPAHTSGFNTNDIVTHFNGMPVFTAPQLKARVMATPPNTRVSVRVMRDNDAVTLYPTLAPRPLSPKLGQGISHPALERNRRANCAKRKLQQLDHRPVHQQRHISPRVHHTRR